MTEGEVSDGEKASVMLPGHSSAVIAHQAAHVAHHTAMHAAIQVTMSSARHAAVLELADRYLGEISEAVAAALQLPTKVRWVRISAEQQRHAIHRRANASQVDAELVAQRLTEALSNVRYQLLPQKDPRVFALVGFVPSADRLLVLPLKLVSAADAKTKEDEWWVQTAHPLGAKNFRKARATGRLVELQPGLLPSNFAPQSERNVWTQ